MVIRDQYTASFQPAAIPQVPLFHHPAPGALGFSLPDFAGSASDISIPAFLKDWRIWLVVLAVVAWWWTGRKSKRKEIAALDAEYARKRAEIEARYTTGGRIRSAGRRAKSLVPKVSFR